MSTAKKIQFTAVIHAPVAVVWNAMLDPETYRQWTSAFAQGSYFEGSWDQGQEIRFLSPSGDGMFAKIAENRRHAFISIRHLGFIAQGTVDTESDAVRAWAPAHENYTFISVPEGTKLVIDQEVTAEFEQYMKDTWPKALTLLKQICESAGAA